MSQREHSLQAAKFGADATRSAAGDFSREEVILAALFHDIGHMLGLLSKDETESMGDCGVMHHERVGGEYLRALGLTERVVKLVQEHVNAKRYLTATNPAYGVGPPIGPHFVRHALWAGIDFPTCRYLAKLSPASRTTLGYQGGPFSPAECDAFVADPDHKVILP